MGFCFRALSVKHLFDVYLLLLIPATTLLLHTRGLLFSITDVHMVPVHFLRAISCISGSTDIEAKARKKLSQFFLRHNPTDASSVIGFLSLLHFLFRSFSGLTLCLFSPSLSLSGTDLWDQPSKTDSEFFTDHECVSSYATEAEMERKQGRTSKYVTYLSVFFSHFSFNLG